MKTRIFAAVLTAVFLFATVGMVTAFAYTAQGESEDEFVKGGEPYEPEAELFNGCTGVYKFNYRYLATEPPVIPEARPFTPLGTGTVVDNVTDADGKEFFTITSAAGNIFFLIIDRQRDSENVYFLNAVTERDLLALAEASDDTWESSNNLPPIIPDIEFSPPIETEPEPISEPIPEAEQDQSGSNGTIIIIVMVLILGGGAAGYYFKIHLPKQQQSDTEDDFDYDDDYSDDDEVPWDLEDDKDGEE